MADSVFRVKAKIRSARPAATRAALEEMFGLEAVSASEERADELILEAETEGGSMKSLNRNLLSALRRVEKRTTVRAEWEGKTGRERYFDYVLKKGEGL